MRKVLQPSGWSKPNGYANGIAAHGMQIHLAGQIGWNAQGRFECDDLVGQVAQTLRNIVAILAEAGAGPEHITAMTWYFVDKADYLRNLEPIGRVYREVIGRNYPAMTAVQVVALIEDRAKVEIQATAVLPDR